MKLLHTGEEILHYNNLNDLADDLTHLGRRHKNDDLQKLAREYRTEVRLELSKYSHLKGTVCYAPPSIGGNSATRSKEYRKGKIIGGFYFSGHSVRCDFRYDSAGFDTHSIAELREEEEAS